MFNPLADNELRTRSDVQAAVRALATPLKPYFSPGGARVRIGSTAAHFDQHAADSRDLRDRCGGSYPWPLAAATSRIGTCTGAGSQMAATRTVPNTGANQGTETSGWSRWRQSGSHSRSYQRSSGNRSPPKRANT